MFSDKISSHRKHDILWTWPPRILSAYQRKTRTISLSYTMRVRAYCKKCVHHKVNWRLRLGKAFQRSQRGCTHHRWPVIRGHPVHCSRSHGGAPGRHQDLHHRSVFVGQRDRTSAHRVGAETLLSSVVEGWQLRRSVGHSARLCPDHMPTRLLYVMYSTLWTIKKCTLLIFTINLSNVD